MRAFSQRERAADHRAFLYDAVLAKIDRPGFGVEDRRPDIDTFFQKNIFATIHYGVRVVDGCRRSASRYPGKIQFDLCRIFAEDLPAFIDDGYLVRVGDGVVLVDGTFRLTRC